MNPVTIAKIALGVAGLAIFALSMKPGMERLRWVAIGLLAVAFLLRFADRRRPPRE